MLPSTRQPRFTTFGIGEKSDLTNRYSVAPPPGSYNAPSDFENNLSRRGFSFGFGRDEVVGGPLE
jgi:hypothetical protein